MAETKEKNKSSFNIDIEEMAKTGLHFGHRTSKINPKMRPYISGIRSTIHIIDLEKTKELLIGALDFIQKLILENKILLLVGTKIQTKNMVESLAKDCNLPYVNERWLGGTFTNLNSILKRVEYYKDLEKKKGAGELEKYTKKERANFDQELKRLEIKFKGIKDLNRLPDAIFVCDMLKDKLAVKEAREKGIKVIGICDTNADPTLTDYPIPASDDAVPSVKYILDKVKTAVCSISTKSKK
mgnify:CR=1 FL=1